MKRFLVAILICFPLFVYSQSDFRPAYIIGFKNDTTYGLINYNANVNYDCEFKKSPESDVVVYKPFEILSYRFINSKYYISKEVKIKNSYIKIEQLDIQTFRSDAKVTDSKYTVEGSYRQKVFLEFLVEGEMNLYFLKDKQEKEHYYLQDKNDSLYDLAKEEVQTYNNGVLRSKDTKNTYKGMMKAAMIQCPQIFKEVDKTDFNHKKLIKVTSDYHNLVCKDHNCIIYERKISPASFHLGIYGGLDYKETTNSAIYYSNDNEYFYFEPSVSALFGASLHIRNPYPNLVRFSFKANFDYSRSNYKKDIYQHDFLTSRDLKTTIHYDANTINTLLLGVTNFTTKANSPYIDYGFLLQYSFGKEFDGKHPYESDIIYYPYNIGAVLGLGYEIPVFNKSKKIFTELVYKQMRQEYNLNFVVGFEF